MSTKNVIFSNPGDVIDFVKIVVPVRSYESWI